MSAPGTLDAIRAAILRLQKDGHVSVPIGALLNYLDGLEGNHPEPTEARKLLHESQLADLRVRHETNLELFKSVIEAGRTALNYCILVSGGAAIALLTYIGNFLSKNPYVQAPPLIARGLTAFAVAVLAGTIASGSRYVSQAFFASNHHRAGNSFNALSIALVIGAYALFGFGIWFVYEQFS